MTVHELFKSIPAPAAETTSRDDALQEARDVLSKASDELFWCAQDIAAAVATQDALSGAEPTAAPTKKPDLDACDDPAVRALLEVIGQLDALGRRLG